MLVGGGDIKTEGSVGRVAEDEVVDGRVGGGGFTGG